MYRNLSNFSISSKITGEKTYHWHCSHYHRRNSQHHYHHYNVRILMSLTQSVKEPINIWVIPNWNEYHDCCCAANLRSNTWNHTGCGKPQNWSIQGTDVLRFVYVHVRGGGKCSLDICSPVNNDSHIDDRTQTFWQWCISPYRNYFNAFDPAFQLTGRRQRQIFLCEVICISRNKIFRLSWDLVFVVLVVEATIVMTMMIVRMMMMTAGLFPLCR